MLILFCFRMCWVFLAAFWFVSLVIHSRDRGKQIKYFHLLFFSAVLSFTSHRMYWIIDHLCTARINSLRSIMLPRLLCVCSCEHDHKHTLTGVMFWDSAITTAYTPRLTKDGRLLVVILSVLLFYTQCLLATMLSVLWTTLLCIISMSIYIDVSQQVRVAISIGIPN